LYKAKQTNIPFMYQVLDKDTIKEEILPHLSIAKRGFKTKSCLIEVVNSILIESGVKMAIGNSPDAFINNNLFYGASRKSAFK